MIYKLGKIDRLANRIVGVTRFNADGSGSGIQFNPDNTDYQNFKK